MEIKYIKSASRLLNRDCVNKRDLGLSKEVLWVSVGQRVAELPAIEVGGLKNILTHSPAKVIQVRVWLSSIIFFQNSNFDSW